MKWKTAIAAPLALGLSLSACDATVGSLDEELNPRFATAPEDSAAMVQRFHDQYQAGQFGASWDEARQSFKEAQSREEWVALLESMREALGEYEGSEQESILEETYQGEPLITVTYISQFEESPAREMFQLVGSPEGMKLHGWTIEAPPE